MLPRPVVILVDRLGNRRKIVGPKSLVNSFGVGWGSITISNGEIGMAVNGWGRITQFSNSCINNIPMADVEFENI